MRKILLESSRSNLARLDRLDNRQYDNDRMSHDDFLVGYNNKTIRARVNLSRAMGVLAQSGTMPKKYRRAHWLWMNVAIILIVGGLASLFWVPWWAGLGAALLGIVLTPRIRESAGDFVLQYSLESPHFYNRMLQNEVIRIEKA